MKHNAIHSASTSERHVLYIISLLFSVGFFTYDFEMIKPVRKKNNAYTLQVTSCVCFSITVFLFFPVAFIHKKVRFVNSKIISD